MRHFIITLTALALIASLCAGIIIDATRPLH